MFSSVPRTPGIVGVYFYATSLILTPGLGTDTSAFPNQLQSVVIRGDQAYLPNIAASPSGPLRFNLDTHAYVNVIDGVTGVSPSDAPAKSLNLHLGARNPEAGKRKLFFANVWAIGFTNQSGEKNKGRERINRQAELIVPDSMV